MATTESVPKTSNHQRLNEMMCHLTPHEATVPYTICFDVDDNLWAATKGGLFKFSKGNFKLLFQQKNPFPKKIGPYTQVHHYKSKIIFVQTDDKAALSEYRLLDLNGNVLHEYFIDGKINCLTINESGELFMTKQRLKEEEESIIFKSSIDSPVAWDELSSTFDFSFQSLCAYDKRTLAVSVIFFPSNIYSKQSIKWVDSDSGDVLSTFSSSGKGNGCIYFPRCMQKYEDGVLILDKTGRFQKFDRSGKNSEVMAQIDSYIGNGFVVKGNEAIIACSGIVLTKEGKTICDDWIESIKLDGSKWTG